MVGMGRQVGRNEGKAKEMMMMVMEECGWDKMNGEHWRSGG